ncbi:LTA synthase family protein [Bacillus tuaregi]|uniref:LTA synthase family protein n=1 Tax=Bacillus tuaregi TaxID=1816695 RepID=UPI0008F88FAB|nr:LTA synthase family protein [Bacillus tuaregi]
MERKRFNRFISLLAWNGIIAFFVIFVIKMAGNEFNIGSFIFWMQEATKKFSFILFSLFLIQLAFVKIQLKILNKVEEEYPWFLHVFKYSFIFIFLVTSSIFINYYFQYFQFLKDPALTIEWITENTRIMLAGVLYVLFILLLAFALIGNLYVSSIFTGFVLLTLGFIHYHKLNLRVEPLYPADYRQFGALKDVIPMVTEYISVSQILLILFLFIVLFVLVRFLPKLTIPLWVRGILLVTALTMLYSYTYFPKTFMKDFVKNHNIEIVKWNQIENYEVNGFVFGFLSNLNMTIMEKPENYSKQTVLNTANKYVKDSDSKASDSKPNIIYLMSESFWDPTKLDVQFSGNPLKYTHSLMNQHSSGALLSPVFGAATANVEFEALTGFSTAFLKKGGIPYHDIIDKKNFIPTIVSDLKSKEYRALAIHPFNRVFYKRNVVYDIFGFDEFLDMETMNYQDKTPGGTISDESLTYEILDQIKETDEPLFIHAVSMQNHMPYNPGAYENNKIQISGLSPDSTATLESYTEGIRQADKALKILVDELEQLEEPTVIVFWGDHLPILGADLAIYKEAGFGDSNEKKDNQLYSETPLLVYSNFETAKRELSSVSPNYLAPIVYDVSGLEKPPFFQFLEEVKQEIPGLKSDLKIDPELQFITELSEKQEQLIADYRLLVYDLLIGKQYSLGTLFPDN